MRNSTHGFGVYCNMFRVTLFLAFSLTAQAQQQAQQGAQQGSRQPDPLEKAIQDAWQARNSGRFEEAAAAREDARARLQRAPVDSQGFPGWVQQVAQLYQNGGWNLRARGVVQEALARTAALGDSHPFHIAMLDMLADNWRQDGNLLTAVGYLEQASTAQAPGSPSPSAPSSVRGGIRTAASRGGTFRFGGAMRGAYFNYGGTMGGATQSAVYQYTRLAELYQYLGRADSAAAVKVKIRAILSHDETGLAGFYEQSGELDEAAAIYKKLAEQAAEPEAQANAWQSLANLEARQERYTDAVASTRKAIAAWQLSDDRGTRQAPWMRQNLAGYLRQAGLLDQADQVYQQLLQENQEGLQKGQMLAMYSQYLADTKRGAQAESLLKDYLAENPNLEPMQKMNVLNSLSNVAQRTGDSKSAEEYRTAAQALQPQPPSIGQSRIAEKMRKAQVAMNQNRLEEAYGLALEAMDAAAHASDGQQVQWFVPQLAHSLSANKEPAKAEQLFRRLFGLAQTWSVDNMQPLIAVTQNYAQNLMNQPDRIGEVPAAIEQVRRVLTDANGPDSASLVQPLRMKVEFERAHQQFEKADASVRELLALQETLSGNTSEPYLEDLQTAARLYEGANDFARALGFLRKAMVIADLVFTPNDSNNGWRGSRVHMDAALALAHLGQFDEAEKLAEQVVAQQRASRLPSPPLAQELEQIRQMKQASIAATSSRVEK